MQVAMLLADFAEVVSGKLYVMGGGWSITGPHPVPSAVAIKISVPWTMANQKHILKLELLDADSRPVMIPNPEGNPIPLSLGANFEAGRPAGILPGSPLDVPFAVNIPPLPLVAGSRYVWQLSINGELKEEWKLTFSTRAQAVTGAAV